MNRIALLKFLDRLLGPPAAWLAGRGLRGSAATGAGGAALPEGAPVLVIRPGGIGDAARLLGPLAAFRAALPSGTRIDILCEARNRAVFDQAAPAGSRVLPYEERPAGLARRLRRAGYAAVVDTEQSHWFSAVFAAWTRAPARVGFGTVPRRARLYTDAVAYDAHGREDVQFARLFAAAGRRLGARCGRDGREGPDRVSGAGGTGEPAACAERPYAVVHVGGSNASKRWPAERYAAVCDALWSAHGLRCVLAGGAADRAEAARVASLCREAAPENRAGSLSLAGTWALCAGAALFVGPDSGIAHLADLSGTPAAVLFGSGDPAKWGPRHGRAVTAEPPACPCAPCSRYGTLHRRRGCRYECMAGIGAGAVAAAAGALLRCNPSGMERR